MTKIDTQPDALRLADWLEEAATTADMGRKPLASDHRRRAAAELRRLTAENAALAQQIAQDRADAARVSGYFVPTSDKRFADEVLVQRSRQMEGPPKWAARLNGECLNKSGEWEWEPMPSSRDDDFLARCRFDTAEEAIAAVQAAMKEKTP